MQLWMSSIGISNMLESMSSFPMFVKHWTLNLKIIDSIKPLFFFFGNESNHLTNVCLRVCVYIYIYNCRLSFNPKMRLWKSSRTMLIVIFALCFLKVLISKYPRLQVSTSFLHHHVCFSNLDRLVTSRVLTWNKGLDWLTHELMVEFFFFLNVFMILGLVFKKNLGVLMRFFFKKKIGV